MKLKTKVSWLTNRLQQYLFPDFEECYEVKLTKEEKRLVMILEILTVERHISKSSNNQWMGRKLKEREAIARAFVEFSKNDLGEKVHSALVETYAKEVERQFLCCLMSH